MGIPSKIYIRKVHLESLAENNCQLGANLPVGKKPFPMEEKDNIEEYIRQTALWHDAKKEKPNGGSDNNAILLVGLRNGRVDYKYLWTDMEDCWKDIDLLTPPLKKLYDKVLWAYINDLIPGTKRRGE